MPLSSMPLNALSTIHVTISIDITLLLQPLRLQTLHQMLSYEYIAIELNNHWIKSISFEKEDVGKLIQSEIIR
jgi:hypothetical protein